jgi:hypothetical protein
MVAGPCVSPNAAMNTLALRVAAAPKSLLLAVQAALLLTLLSFGTGCGALSAMANPKVAWALRDPAPMDVVVRRVDAAEATGTEVDRLLCSTPVDADSDWLQKTAPSPEDSAAEMKTLSDDPQYKTSQARVVSAEVWAWSLADVTSTSGKSPNLLTLISADLGAKYEEVMAKKRELGAVQGKIAEEKEAADKKGVSDSEKADHKKTIADLKKQADDLDKAVGPLQEAFLKGAKDFAAKAQPDVRTKVGVALVNLRQALDDAEISNGAAAVRYPLAITSIPGALKSQIPVIVADVVEEQTGHRPTLQGFHPDVSLDGTDVKLTINGLSKDDLGKLSIGDLTTETVSRATKWVGRVATLLAVVSTNKETLSFEEGTLDAILDGFKSGGWTRPTPTTIPLGTSREVMTAKAHAPRSHKGHTASSPSAVASASKKDASNAKTVVAAAIPGKTTARAPKVAVASAAAVRQVTKVAASSTASPPAAAPADDAHLSDERSFASHPRSVTAIQNALGALLDARDHASAADRPGAVLAVADAYSELDYAATAAGDKAMASSARQAAIDSYEDARATHAAAVDATALLHLAIAYERDGNAAQQQKVLGEIQRRWPNAKVVTRAG